MLLLSLSIAALYQAQETAEEVSRNTPLLPKSPSYRSPNKVSTYSSFTLSGSCEKNEENQASSKYRHKDDYPSASTQRDAEGSCSRTHKMVEVHDESDGYFNGTSIKLVK